MNFYIPFGDWSGDGHEHYDRVLVEAESMEKLLEAENKIKAIYGEKFFDGYAETCDNPKLAPECWQALIDNNMPIDILETSEMLYPDDDGIYNIKDYLKAFPNPYVNLEFVKYSFIWLLNEYGANIKILSDEEDIPQINNWTCPGFDTVGYGCFT